MNPSHASSNASTGRRGAWFSMGTRDGTRRPLWSPPTVHTTESEQGRARTGDSERMPRSSSRMLRWLAALIAIGSVIIALMLATSTPV